MTNKRNDYNLIPNLWKFRDALNGGAKNYKNYGSLFQTIWQIIDAAENGDGLGGVGEWDFGKDYTFPSIVGDGGEYYIALQDVPAGILLDDEDYWIRVGAETDPVYIADKPSILRHYDIDDKDWSVEAELPNITDGSGNMDLDYEFGYQTPEAPHSGVTGPYNADWLSLGGKKTFAYKNGDTESTNWIHNFGNSEVDTQILSHNRPLVWNGQDDSGAGGRHEMAYVEDADEALDEAKEYTDEKIAEAVLADQTWLPAADNYSVLPTVPNEDLNYLCRVFNYYTDGIDEYDAGVYQWIAGGTEWTYFSDNQDWVDDEELAEAMDEKVDKTDSPSKIYGTDEDGEQVVIARDSLGKVDTVDGLEADTDKNVQLTYVYETIEQWEDGDGDLPSGADLPVGATAIKTYEHKNNQYIVSEVPDGWNSANLFPATPSPVGTTFVVPHDGFLTMTIKATNATAGGGRIFFSINSYNYYSSGGAVQAGGAGISFRHTFRVSQGDVIGFSITEGTGAWATVEANA